MAKIGIKEELRAKGIKVFDLVCTVSAPMEGTIRDWPAKIQDRIYGQLEKLATREQCPVTIVWSGCKEDHDVVDPALKWYIHVIASEVVIKPVDAVRDHQLQNAINQTMQSIKVH